MSIVQALAAIAPQRLADEADQPEVDCERRETQRIDCQMDAFCQPIAGLAGNRWPARAVDISTLNVSLLVSRRFEPGTLLAIGLQGSLDDCHPLARVERVAPAGNYWRIGCLWADPLSEDELRSLIGTQGRP
jgi:hypothetical protein